MLSNLDLSSNEIGSLDFSSPIQPTDDGLAYGAGFLSTSISRSASAGPRPIWPELRVLNLGYNKITNDGLRGSRDPRKLALRTLNLENNRLEGELDLDASGLTIPSMPELSLLVLSGNKALRGTTSSTSKSLQIEMTGCNASGFAPSNGTSEHVAVPIASSVGASSAAVESPTTTSATNSLPVPEPTTTITYKTCPASSFDADPLAVDFDLYLPPEPSEAPLPLVIWFHGGGLLQGNKENLMPHLRRLPSTQLSTPTRFAVISPNYRLAPQVPIIDILLDMTDLLAFVRTRLNPHLESTGSPHRIDTKRICLTGSSAGGYLALIVGLPVGSDSTDEQLGGYRGEFAASAGGLKCLAPFCPITDLTDPFWATETNPVPWRSKSVTHAEAKPHIDLKAPPIATCVSGGPRSILYSYMLQHALFPSLLFMRQRSVGSGVNAFRPEPLQLSIPYRLELLAKSQKAGRAPAHPPVYLAFGTIDDKVQKFEKTIEAFNKVEGDFELEVREGADHAYDEEVNEECEAFREWLVKHL